MAAGRSPEDGHPLGVQTMGDRLCLAYSGTLVAYGQGQGVVVATGANTEMGRIGRLLATLMGLQAGLPPLDFSDLAG